jgi:DNA excision repair protein ERCC-4
VSEPFRLWFQPESNLLASNSMAANTEETARIVVESKESVSAFPRIPIGTCGIENYQTVEIVADDRERPSGVVAELEKAGKATVKVEHLSVGDYCVDGAVLIERKTAADFAQSLMDGRLFSQAGRMSSSPFRPAYIIEGTSTDWSGLGVSREALQGALVTLMLIFDVPVFRSTEPAETARLIYYIGSQLVRLRDPGYAPYRQGKAKRKKTRQLRVLQSLPGIGADRAKKLLERFGTVRACFIATPAELLEVDGIGSKTAAAIDQVIN